VKNARWLDNLILTGIFKVSRACAWMEILSKASDNPVAVVIDRLNKERALLALMHR